ncbi:MAG: hypothetical protein ACRCXZ_03425 [Patescibacteria group bacterium]
MKKAIKAMLYVLFLTIFGYIVVNVAPTNSIEDFSPEFFLVVTLTATFTVLLDIVLNAVVGE